MNQSKRLFPFFDKLYVEFMVPGDESPLILYDVGATAFTGDVQDWPQLTEQSLAQPSNHNLMGIFEKLLTEMFTQKKEAIPTIERLTEDLPWYVVVVLL